MSYSFCSFTISCSFFGASKGACTSLPHSIAVSPAALAALQISSGDALRKETETRPLFHIAFIAFLSIYYHFRGIRARHFQKNRRFAAAGAQNANLQRIYRL